MGLGFHSPDHLHILLASSKRAKTRVQTQAPALSALSRGLGSLLYASEVFPTGASADCVLQQCCDWVISLGASTRI